MRTSEHSNSPLELLVQTALANQNHGAYKALQCELSVLTRYQCRDQLEGNYFIFIFTYLFIYFSINKSSTLFAHGL